MPSMTPEQLAQLSPEYLAENNGHVLVHVSIAFLVLQTFFFILFIVSRFTVKPPHGIETFLFMPAAYLFGVGGCLIGIILVKVGGQGRHIAYWLLKNPHKVTTLLKIETAMEIIYFGAIAFPKLAIMALYLRIFPNKWVRRLVWLNSLIIILNALTSVIEWFAFCRPFQFRWDKTIKGHCGNMLAAYRFFSVPNMLSDIVILILPIASLYKLNVSPLKKAGILITFLMGSLGIVTATLRFVEFWSVDIFTDLPYLGTKTGLWTIIEPAAYLIFATLPGLRPLLRKLFQGKRFSRNLHTKTRRATDGGRGSINQGKSLASRKNHNVTSFSNPPAIYKTTEVSLRTLPADAERSGFVRLDEDNLGSLQDCPSDLEAGFHVYQGTLARPKPVAKRGVMEGYDGL